MNDERTISNDNFLFRVLHTRCAHHNYNFSFPWRSIDHMISFSLIILGILYENIFTRCYCNFFFASHEKKFQSTFLTKCQEEIPIIWHFAGVVFFSCWDVFERGSLHVQVKDKKKNKHFHGEIFIHSEKAIFFLKLEIKSSHWKAIEKKEEEENKSKQWPRLDCLLLYKE